MENIEIWVYVVIIVVCVVYVTRSFMKESFSGSISDNTIFVSVASYRDNACDSTIEEILSNADVPGRVFIGICEQNHKDFPDESCTRSPLSGQYKDNIRKKELDHSEAKGPTYARYWCSTLYQKETFFLQIDSHTRFKKGWDTLLINQWTDLHENYGVKKPVLSTYPASWDNKNDDQVPVLCRSTFNEQGIPTLLSILKKPSPDGKYFPTAFASGGFLFMKGLEVPFDPNLPHLFQGEEVCYAARLWTSGFDIFTPRVNAVYHHYERKDQPKFWNDIKGYKDAQKDSIKKVKYLLKMSTERPPENLMVDMHLYGLGNARSIEEYYTFAGLDIAQKKSTSGDKFC